MTAKAVLFGFDGSQRVITVPYPPPHEWQMPVTTPMALDEASDRSQPVAYIHRVFRLRTDMRSLEHRWEKAYNEAYNEDRLTWTLEPGYVYMEVR